MFITETDTVTTLCHNIIAGKGFQSKKDIEGFETSLTCNNNFRLQLFKCQMTDVMWGVLTVDVAKDLYDTARIPSDHSWDTGSN